MGSRWRTWDLDCLEETLLTRDVDDEVEPLIAFGCRREIPRVDFSSLVLPKEALFSTNDNHSKSSKSRGRGRSLANRALGFDKPSRRPGERDTSEKVGAVGHFSMWCDVTSTPHRLTYEGSHQH